MILRIEDLKAVCNNLLLAVESSENLKETECLELVTVYNFLYLNVTNGDYFARFRLKIFSDENLHATVDAKLFLNLIKKTTTETVELTVENNALVISGNGKYKLPLIYKGDTLLELTPIGLENVTTIFDIPNSTLKNILRFNTVELKKGAFAQPVQKLYYIDDEGAITFTTGACVNKFSLDNKIKILLTPNIVKLFKIFEDDTIRFSLAQDVKGSILQTKVCFSDSKFSLVSIINNSDELLNSVPVSDIRNMSYGDYDNIITLPRNDFLQALERITLFNGDIFKCYGVFEFGLNSLKIFNSDGDSYEDIKYSGGNVLEDLYKGIYDTQEIRQVLNGCLNEYVTVKFGNSKAMVIQSGDIYYVIPECSLE